MECSKKVASISSLEIIFPAEDLTSALEHETLLEFAIVLEVDVAFRVDKRFSNINFRSFTYKNNTNGQSENVGFKSK